MSKNISLIVLAVVTVSLIVLATVTVINITKPVASSNSSSSISSVLVGEDGCPQGQSKKIMPSMCMPDSRLPQPNGSKMMNDSMMMAMSMTDMVTDEKSFLFEMIPHHQEAVDTSEYLISKTQDQELKQFAQQVISAQKTEIEQMKNWYKQWYGSEYKTNTNYMPMMADLTKYTGKNLDKIYIEGMIGHHEMALDMAKKVLTFSSIRTETKQLSNNILSSQTKEVGQLKSWLLTKFN